FEWSCCLKEFWENNVKDAPGLEYPSEFMFINIPLYIAIWLTSVFFSGGYDRPVSLSRIIRGLLVGTLFVAALYGFMEEEYRFSRAMILLGAAWSILAMIGSRWLFHLLGIRSMKLDQSRERKLLIAGEFEEVKRVLSLLNRVGSGFTFIGYVSDEPAAHDDDPRLGSINELDIITNIYGIEEVIFCSNNVSSQHIIEWMSKIGSNIDYKIVPQNSQSIIGSNSKNSAGDLYAIDINLAINTSMARRNKRVLDILLSLFFLISLPIQMFFVEKPGGLIRNILLVLTGRKSWVGYTQMTNVSEQDDSLPTVKDGVLSKAETLTNNLDQATISRLNMLYAREYSIWKDISIIKKAYKKLGTTVYNV
ncbi:MAG: glycosyl transferase family 2, partial [Bacteroidetes bacterium]|nr:glycosyl transferase family 2 [Bacteroidota bacterium]